MCLVCGLFLFGIMPVGVIPNFVMAIVLGCFW